MVSILTAFALSLILAMLLVPAFSGLAQRIGLVDHPDNKRKLHLTAIPMVGGLALFVAVTACAFLVPYLHSIGSESFEPINRWFASVLPSSLTPRALKVTPQDAHELLGLLVGAAVLLLVGVADDRFGIRGRQKLAGQFIATTILILFGYQFNSVTVGGITINFGIFSAFVIYGWVIASINSVNLLDGADGIASTIGVVMSLAMTVMMVSQGKTIDAVIAVSIAGGLLGFLRYNFPPARAYLGDAGSMLIGFLLAALAVRCTFKQNSAYAFFAPIALLAIPFIDTGAAIVRRRLTGRSIFAVDRGHLHHSLAKRGYSPKASLLWVALLCSATAAGGTMALIHHQSEYALVSIAIVGCVMVFFRIFGVGEMQLVTRRASSVAKSVFRVAPGGERSDVVKSFVHVQGDRDWQNVWGEFCRFANQFQLDKITLDVNAPWLHESFHADQKRAGVGEVNHQWESSVPLIAGGRLFGKVSIESAPDNGFTHQEVIAELLEVVSVVEQFLLEDEV